MNFGLLLNPLTPDDFSEIRGNSVSYLGFQMAIKWSKMTLESPLKNENEVNFIIFNLSVPDFSYLISKSFCDVISDTWFSCPHTGTVVLNGLNRMSKTQFFLKFGVFITKTGQKVHFG